MFHRNYLRSDGDAFIFIQGKLGLTTSTVLSFGRISPRLYVPITLQENGRTLLSNDIQLSFEGLDASISSCGDGITDGCSCSIEGCSGMTAKYACGDSSVAVPFGSECVNAAFAQPGVFEGPYDY